MSTIPRVIIHLDGGLVSAIESDYPLVVIVADHDIDGVQDDELAGVGDAAAIVSVWDRDAITVDPLRVQAQLDAYQLTEDDTC